jgi:alpha-ketoglutarate-dependent taurine dioxygenase
MVAAYEGLDDETKAEADGLVAMHDYMRAFGFGVPEGEREATRKRYPRVEHPVIRTHPETGRKLIYVNRFFVDHIAGVSPERSIELMRLLCRQAELPEYQVRFRWKKDSVAFWDNRAVQHYAASDYWPDVRVMERATIIGDRPF